MKAMIYLDANIFIYPITGTGTKSEACIEILDKVFNGEQEAGTSVLTWDEFQYSLWKTIGKEKAIEESSIFLKSPNLKFFKVDSEIIQKAQKLSEEYNLKPRDAIHTASMIVNGIKEIISDDPDFDKVQEIKRISP